MGARQFARGMKTGLQPYLEQRRRDIAADSDFERSQKAADIQYGRQKESATTLSDRNKERDTIRFGRKLEAAQFSSDLTFKSKQELDKYKHDTRMKGIAAAQAEYDKTGDPSVFAEYLPDKYKNLWSKENMTKYQAESLKGQKTRDQAYIERLKDQGNEKESKRIERLWARAKAYPQMIDDPKDKRDGYEKYLVNTRDKNSNIIGEKEEIRSVKRRQIENPAWRKAMDDYESALGFKSEHREELETSDNMKYDSEAMKAYKAVYDQARGLGAAKNKYTKGQSSMGNRFFLDVDREHTTRGAKKQYDELTVRAQQALADLEDRVRGGDPEAKKIADELRIYGEEQRTSTSTSASAAKPAPDNRKRFGELNLIDE